jgi:hypothetical protein
VHLFRDMDGDGAPARRRFRVVARLAAITVGELIRTILPS